MNVENKASIVGDVEHLINMKTGDAWVLLRTEETQLVSIVMKSMRLPLSQGTSVVFFGRWAPADTGGKIFVADSCQEATRRVQMIRTANATRATRTVYVGEGSPVGARVRRDLATLFGGAEDWD